jgi:hypothetical protein
MLACRGQACENLIMFNTILINTNLAPGSPSAMAVADVPHSSPRIKAHVVLLLISTGWYISND